MSDWVTRLLLQNYWECLRGSGPGGRRAHRRPPWLWRTQQGLRFLFPLSARAASRQYAGRGRISLPRRRAQTLSVAFACC